MIFKRPFFLLFLVLIAGWMGRTAVAQELEPLFINVSEEAGIVDNRMGDEKVIGQAWGDYDNDGWPDLFVTDHEGPNTLYHNQGDGTFIVSPLSSGLALWSGYSSGATFVDYDNDGWRDLYVLNWGENVLYRNLNGEKFENVTAVSGIGGDANSKTASWGDFDQDGFVDLYVANWACYPNCGRPSSGESDKLYRNNGDGTFEDVSALLSDKITGAGFVATFTDYDNDGDLDIYLVNDEFINPIGNGLWRNDGPGCDGWCFTEVSEEAEADTQLMGMGLATADYDNDGDQDFYFSNAGPMTLLQNQGDGSFTDVANAVGVVTKNSIGWGAVFFDYDNDGWQDLYLAVSDAANQDGKPNNPLYRNDTMGSFDDVSRLSGVSDPGSTLGVATADYDRDGRLDLLIGDTDSGYSLYRNQASADNHWLALELVGGGSVNRDAIGSRVYITTDDGLTRMQEIICGSSLGAGNELALHFGLGENEEIAEMRIVWPNGLTQIFEDVMPDRRISLAYPVDETVSQAQRITIYGEEPAPSFSFSFSFSGWGRWAGVVMLGLFVLITAVPWVGRKWKQARF